EAVRQDDGDFSFIHNNGKAKKPCPVFQVRFKNRSTFWQYFDKKKEKDSSKTKPIQESKGPLPLTHFGNAGTKQKPSKEALVKVKKEKKDDNERITKLVSELFI
ncbi:MAG: hypothetical protein D3910_10120, partial [Candidatus Electrothrix sp. ATG2]|nr:hypothetical protein [Candidatus Electrothrix sp. ATG2]